MADLYLFPLNIQNQDSYKFIYKDSLMCQVPGYGLHKSQSTLSSLQTCKADMITSIFQWKA